MTAPNEAMESLTDIMARMGPLMAQRYAALSAPQPAGEPTPSSAPVPGSATLAPVPGTASLAPTATSCTTQPDYIQAEAFLEMSGFFTPSSKQIKGIYVKEKKLREYVDTQGNKQTFKIAISANHQLGLPITSDLDYYRAFLKICDEIVDRDGRFKLPIVVPTSTLIRYVGKTENTRVWHEVRAWFDRMNFTGMKGAMGAFGDSYVP